MPSRQPSTRGRERRTSTVLLTLATPDATGAPRMACLYAMALHQAGHRVTLAHGRLKRGGEASCRTMHQMFQALRTGGIGVRQVAGMERCLNRRALKTLSDLVIAEDARCLIGFQPRDQLAAMLVARRLKRPCVVSAQNRHTFWGSWPVRAIKSVVYARALRRCPKLVICTSEVVRHEVVRFGVDSNRVCQLPNAIDVATFSRRNGPRPTDAIRRELGIRPHQLMLANIGRINVQKGQLELLRAFSEVSDRRPEARLVIVGEVSTTQRKQMLRYYRQLRRFVTQRGIEDRVVFTGWRNDVPELLSAADMYVHAALWEGPPLPLATLEAMSAGQPTILTDCSGYPEGFENGKHGYIVPTGDSGKLRDAIEQLIELGPERRRRIGRAGRAYVKQHNDIQMVGTRFVEMVESIM